MIRDITTTTYGDEFTGKQVHILLPDRHILYLRSKGLWVGEEGEAGISYNQGSIKLVSVLGEKIDRVCKLLRYSSNQVTIEEIDELSLFCRVAYKAYYDGMTYNVNSLRERGGPYFSLLATQMKQNISVCNWNRYGGYELGEDDYPHYNILFGHGIDYENRTRRLNNIFGFPLTLSQSRGYFPSTKGTGVKVKNLTCPVEGKVWGEYTNNSLYVLFCPQNMGTDPNLPKIIGNICGYMAASVSGNKTAITDIEAALEAQRVIAQKAAKLAFIERLKGVPKEKLKALKEEEVGERNQLESYYQEVERVEKKLKAAILAYELYLAHHLATQGGDGEAQLTEFFSLVDKSEDILKMEFTDTGLDIFTDHVFITYQDVDYLVGRLIIHINVEDNVVNFSRDPASTPHVKLQETIAKFHPHANRNGWNGTCWGNIERLYRDLLRKGEFVQLTHLLMTFLRSCTRGSGYTSYLNGMYKREELEAEGITLT